MSHRMHQLRPSTILNFVVVALSVIVVTKTMAQGVYSGCGIACGITGASGITGLSTATSLTEIIFNVINFILDIALILAVLAIIIAGIYLITSNGDEGQKDKAKKIIYYCIAGIALIAFSRVIVMLVNHIFFA